MPKYNVPMWANALIVASRPDQAAAEVRLGNWSELIGIDVVGCYEIDDPEDLGQAEFPDQAGPDSGGKDR